MMSIASERLKKSVVVLGLTKGGVSGADTDRPVQSVFLLLSPLEHPEMQVRLLGLISRIFMDKQLIEKLLTSETSKEARDILSNWEYTRH